MQLECLEIRKLKYDLVILHELIRDYFDSQRVSFFEFLFNSCTRGNEYNAHKQYSSAHASKFSFSHRRLDIWNSLPIVVVEAVTFPEFKHKQNNVDLF